MKKILSLLLVFVLIFSVVACSKPAEKKDDAKKDVKKEEKAKDTLVLISREINYTFDPTKPQTDGYFRRCGALEALFHIESDGSVKPWLAEGAKQLDPKT